MTDLLKFCDSEESTSTLGWEVVVEARTWLGTPFRHQGRIKNVGVDCLGLLVGVAAELNLKSKTGEPLTALDELGYGHFPDSDYLQKQLAETMEVIEKPIVGSIGLFCIDGRAQHLGIFGTKLNQESGIKNQEVFSHDSCFMFQDSMTLIHAYAPMRKVVEHGFTDEWKARLIKAYCCVTEQV